MKKKPEVEISSQTPFKVIGIHNALPCSALAEAYGQKQKKLFEDQIKSYIFCTF
jgi:hypothetical protein